MYLSQLYPSNIQHILSFGVLTNPIDFLRLSIPRHILHGLSEIPSMTPIKGLLSSIILPHLSSSLYLSNSFATSLYSSILSPIALQYNLKLDASCSGFQLIIHSQLSAPNKSLLALIKGSASAEFKSISGMLLAPSILSTDINRVGNKVIGEANLSMFVKSNNLVI